MAGNLFVSAAIGLLLAFFLGLFVAMAAPIEYLRPVEFMICKEGETLDRQYYQSSYHRPGETGVRFVVLDEAGETLREPGLVVFLCTALVLWPVGTLLVAPFVLLHAKRLAKRKPKAEIAKDIAARLQSQGITVESVSDTGNIQIGDLGDLGGIIKSFTASSVGSNAEVVAASIEKLKELMDKGLISREDYEAKKAELLKRL